jgi:hypothetical protein
MARSVILGLLPGLLESHRRPWGGVVCWGFAQAGLGIYTDRVIEEIRPPAAVS